MKLITGAVMGSCDSGIRMALGDTALIGAPGFDVGASDLRLRRSTEEKCKCDRRKRDTAFIVHTSLELRPGVPQNRGTTIAQY